MSDGVLMVDPKFLDRVKRDEPMSRHTSWHVGGPADVFFEPRDRADLLAFLGSLPEGTPLFWLGLGSCAVTSRFVASGHENERSEPEKGARFRDKRELKIAKRSPKRRARVRFGR